VRPRAGRWRVVTEGLALGTLRLTFQRYALPATRTLAAAPRSAGALPVGAAGSTGGQSFVLPLAENEGFWIGGYVEGAGNFFLALGWTSGSVTRDVGSGKPWSDAPPPFIALPPDRVFPGVTLPGGGYRAFAREAAAGDRTALRIVARAGSDEAQSEAVLAVADYPDFVALTGLRRPAPLDLKARYRGQRLP
jgi:hypothetical protein